MPTLEELDTICTMLEERDRHSIYRPPLAASNKPHAMRHGQVVWIVKDGRPVDFSKRSEQ
jgi:hypothetical protein